MFRIDSEGAVTAIPPPAPLGAPGFFTGGSPQAGQEATIVSADWLNAVQEELNAVIETAGITLSKTDRTQLLQALRLNGLQPHDTAVFNATGTTNWTVPTNVYHVMVEVWGGGGGSSGGNGSGGSAGGYTRDRIAVTPGQVIPITVGVGGTGAASAAAATPGGTSSFGSFCSATGGTGGSSGPGPGGGGNGVGGSLNLQGGAGTDIDGSTPGGRGGSAPRGGEGGIVNGAALVQGAQWPGAGAGANVNVAAGYNGAQGGVYLEW